MKKSALFLICIILSLVLVACDSGRSDVDPTNAPTAEPKPTKGPLGEDKLGLPNENTEVIYKNDFEGNDIVGDLLVQRGVYSIDNGKLY